MPAGSYLFFSQTHSFMFYLEWLFCQGITEIWSRHHSITQRYIDERIRDHEKWTLANYTSDYQPKSFPPSVRCFPTPLIIFFYSLLIMISFYLNLISDRLRGI